MKRSLALLTIGRSPRPDLRDDLEGLLRPGIDLVEAGALDAVDDAAIEEFLPTDDDDALIAPIGGGREVIVSKKAIGRRLAVLIRQMEGDLDGFAILCAGEFPSLHSNRLVAQTGKLLLEAGAALKPGKLIGVLAPIEEQREINIRVWSAGGRKTEVEIASPFHGMDTVVAAARELQRRGAFAIAMSCMGYSEVMRAAVVKATGLPAIAPSQVLADAINKEWQ